MLSNIELVGLIIGLVWLLILSILFFRMSSHYNNLVKGVSNKTLKSVLENLLKELSIAQKDISYLASRCDKIEKDGLFHIQKIGLLRFNPFKDTGGNQSFIVAFVDGNNTGIVISGLYSRSGTRWYAKKVVKGVGTEHELSEEEKKTISEAKKVSQ